MPRRPEPNKRKRKYRFSGLWGMQIGVSELRGILVNLRKRLEDPNNSDDIRWVTNWIAATEAEIEKKLAGKTLKARNQAKAKKRLAKRTTEQS